MNIRYIHLLLGTVLIASCNSQSDVLPDAINGDESIIHVGQVSAASMLSSAPVTRSSSIIGDEKLSWLETGLRGGMNIFYFKDSETTGKQAFLKLEDDNTYSLKTPVTEANPASSPCKWLGNGEHTFQGAYVPTDLYDTTTHSYSDLEHYTAMPPSTKIAATVGSITIPLQHRLARVVAYVLIDDKMGTTLKGYDETNYNAENTMLRFCNVWTLNYVDREGHPIWKKERKAIPHYLGKQHVKVYKDSSNKLIFPVNEDKWKVADDAYAANPTDCGYTCTDYGMAPYFDLIVRPTYTVTPTGANVMNDEFGEDKTDSKKNCIDFEMTLDNDLEYEKHFEFDLNANDETVVYLRVTPERIDYNSTGSRLWKSSSYSDNYYGVNNENNNTLSVAGSSWQRAFTNSTLDIGVTDGHKYNADDEDHDAQYVKDEKWIELLTQATTDGKYHGRYFILHKDITIDISKFPADFVFSGHLDALDHSINLTGTDPDDATRNWLFKNLQTDWQAEVVNTVVKGGLLFKDKNDDLKGHVENCKDDGGQRVHEPEIPTY